MNRDELINLIIFHMGDIDINYNIYGGEFGGSLDYNVGKYDVEVMVWGYTLVDDMMFYDMPNERWTTLIENYASIEVWDTELDEKVEFDTSERKMLEDYICKNTEYFFQNA